MKEKQSGRTFQVECLAVFLLWCTKQFCIQLMKYMSAATILKNYIHSEAHSH